MSARVADEPMKMPHSPFWKRGSADCAPPQKSNSLGVCHSASCPTGRTPTELLKSSPASSPPKPLDLVASGRLWKAERFSTLIQDGHEVVKPQTTPRSRSFLAAAPSSGHVRGAALGSRPASRNMVLL